MTGSEILNIEKCGDLFPNDSNLIKTRYKELAREWHPDTNNSSMANDVFTKITELYNKALKLIDDGLWEKTNYISIMKESGGGISISYDTNFDFELGMCYVTKSKIIYVLDKDKKKYYNNAVSMIESLKYQDKDMEDKMKMLFPKICSKFKSVDGKYVIVMDKSEDVVPLRCVLDYFHNKINDRHVAWIISRLCNISCYLKFNGIVHNGININNCFVSPQFHSILLLGGWWYATKEDDVMIGTTKDIFSIMSVSAKGNKISNCLTDLESIKLLGRQLLGEINCRKLILDKSIPEPFTNFLISGSSKNPFDEFKKWDKSLNDSYGKRKFVKMEINNLYGKKGD